MPVRKKNVVPIKEHKCFDSVSLLDLHIVHLRWLIYTNDLRKDYFNWLKPPGCKVVLSNTLYTRHNKYSLRIDNVLPKKQMLV